MKEIKLHKRLSWVVAMVMPMLMVVLIQFLMYGLNLFSANILLIVVLAFLPSYLVFFLVKEPPSKRLKYAAIFSVLLIAYVPLLAFPYFLHTACFFFKECHLL